MKALLSFFLVLFIGAVQGQTVTGLWKTIDDDTGVEKSIVEIYQQDGKIYGKVKEILNKDRADVVCDRCDGDKRNQPVQGMVIIEGMEKDGNQYSGGTILDPEKGKQYKCKLWVDEDNPNILNVRGYIAFLYRTQYWKRVE
ncbi:hypothetical protein I215_05847 [Galbibacter marinus]|uniref:DUF2147 domain-containing protein n=1 Tax=Galbibacter marinus TaxID=555500 RepID=K2P3W8_9FLAO|nr:DUF2147 domain-containing protein [Galbibacter marinus]EKF55733.1 hypothetical protein I215_05847 [Galbibacter marinus]